MDETIGAVKKNRSTDVILVLKPIDGKGRSTHGLTDTRLFSGGNRLHAIMDTQICHWYLQYDSGTLPEPLKQRFTSYTKLLTFVTNYFKNRNVDIVEVID